MESKIVPVAVAVSDGAVGDCVVEFDDCAVCGRWYVQFSFELVARIVQSLSLVLIKNE